MRGIGDCWDKAVSETFFATLKTELVQGCAFATCTEAYDVISSTIGQVSPNDFELHWDLPRRRKRINY